MLFAEQIKLNGAKEIEIAIGWFRLLLMQKQVSEALSMPLNS